MNKELLKQIDKICEEAKIKDEDIETTLKKRAILKQKKEENAKSKKK